MIWSPGSRFMRPMKCAALALGALVAFEYGWWPLGVVLIVFAALTKESMPVWAALWSWAN